MLRLDDLQEQTRKLAYEHWLRRGRPFGSAEVDWFAAEKEIAANRDVWTPDDSSLYGLSLEPCEDRSSLA